MLANFNNCIFQYFPPKTGIWYIYCIIVAGLIAIIKLLNYALHRMYDTTECIKEEAEDELDPQKRYCNSANFSVIFQIKNLSYK